MLKHGTTHSLRGACGRFASILLLAAFVADPQIASAEPLGYVLRPDRQDIGVMDGRSNSVLGGIPLSTAFGDNIGVLNFLRLRPDGRAGLIGATGMGLSYLDVLSARVVETLGGPGRPDPLDATAAVFKPDSAIAYVSIRRSGLLLEVDTSAGRAEILRSWDAQPYIQLFYVPQLGNPGSPDGGPVLIGLQENGAVTAFDLVLGREIGSENAALRSQLIELGDVVEMTVEPDGSVWALARDGVIRNLPGSWLGKLPYQIFSVPTNAADLVGPTEHFAIGEGGRALYLAGPKHAVELQCLRTGGSPGSPVVEFTTVAPCDGELSERIVVTHITLGEVLETGEVRPPDNFNPIGDVTLTSDGATLYVVGRRTIFAIDTATATLVAGFRMRAGGGELGQLAVGDAVSPCVPQSTSIFALQGEAKRMSTSARSQNQVYFKLKKAQKGLVAGDIATGRSALQAAIARTTYLSNLPADDPDRILPDEAASVVCAAANLLERVRQE